MTGSWSRKALGEVLSVQNGYAFDSKAFGGTGFPLIRIRDLKAGVSTETRYGAEFDPRYVVKAGDFLIGMDGEFGCYEWKGEPALLNQRVCRLQGFGEALTPRFLFYGINAHLKAIEEVTGYTTVKHLSSKQILGIEMLIPPRDEQQRIVAILDEAFESIATAKANAEKNLQNARELFESQLFALLENNQATWPRKTLREVAIDFGRGRSKHRPRNDPKLYGDTYPFIQTGDVRNAEHLITEYTQSYSEAGLAQSKLWPKGTLCITIAANIAETGVLDFDACFPDSVIGVVVDEAQTSSKYLEYMLHTVKAELKAKGKGSAQDNINLATFENERFPFPDLSTQTLLVRRLDELLVQTQQLEDICLRKLAALEELKKSLLHQAFSGQLSSSNQSRTTRQSVLQTATAEFTAHVISIAYVRHERLKREKTFGRVKEQKILHLVESAAGIDLGRQPMRDAAGPNDFQHMLKAEEWAKSNGFFEMVKTGEGYEFRKLSRFEEQMSRANQALAPYQSRLEPIIDLLVPLDKEEAEVFATVHAAWNNLLIDGVQATDGAIVLAARQEWHPDKLKIPEHKFRSAIEKIRREKLVPTGAGKYVGGQKALFNESDLPARQS